MNLFAQNSLFITSNGGEKNIQGEKRTAGRKKEKLEKPTALLAGRRRRRAESHFNNTGSTGARQVTTDVFEHYATWGVQTTHGLVLFTHPDTVANE
ncbi:unnamed protein product [Rodentolepis nana]|uniref:Uncharacterized protein n=1 Tax=Rodentolepis nana TaxID=102285 RepID=A0A0R3TNL9_RODNA|nr:unnamed protein product [Rodentolepis nana]